MRRVSKKAASKPKHIFLSVRAQPGNLGDFIIRRYVTDLVNEAGGENHLLAKDVPAGFVSGLGLRPNAVMYYTTVSWIRALLLTQLCGRRGILVFTPGPEALKNGPLASVRRLFNVLLSLFMRLTAGKVMKVGRSISAGSPLNRLLERIQVRLSCHYSVRDFESAQLLGSDAVEVRPDVAFAARLGSEERPEIVDRNIVAFSFREDRTINWAHLTQLISETRQLGLTPVFLSQVRRDDPFNSRLAGLYGADLIIWLDGTCEESHLSEVLSIYGRSRVVVSNRLHAIIFGLRCGAAPLGLGSTDDRKLKKTLSVIGLSGVVADERELIEIEDVLGGFHRAAVAEAICVASAEREYTAGLLS